MGRKPPLGGDGWISSPERRETANCGRSFQTFLTLLEMFVARRAVRFE